MGKWEEKAWKEVLSIINGKNQKAVLDENGKYPIYGSGGIMAYANDYLCEEGTTIVGRKGSINNPIYIETKFWNVDTAFGISSGDKLESKFLHYFCLGYDFTKHNKSTTLPSLTKRDLLEIKIPLPPLPEQQRIVAKLDGLFAKIDKAIGLLEENIKHTKALMGSVLDEEFGRLEDFNILTIDEAKESNVIGLVRSVKTQDFSNDYEYLKMNNISRDGDLDLTNMVRVNAKKEEFAKYTLKKGDFLFNTRNSVELVGKTAIYDLDKPILYNNNIMRLRFKEGINPYFINFQFFSNKTKADLERIKSGTTSVAAIYYKTFKKLELKIPKLEIQNKLVQRLSKFSNKLKQTTDYQTQKLNHLKALKSSLLDQAFKGEL